MQAFDTVIRNGTLATAADVYEADLGIADGRSVAIGLGWLIDRLLGAGLTQPRYHADSRTHRAISMSELADVIWDGLASGLFAIVSSDHAPFRYNDPEGKMLGSDQTPFNWVPNGVPGIRNDMLHHNVDYTPYEGLEITGWPELALSRGEIVVEHSECIGTPGRGLFLRRAAPEPAKPRKRAR